MLAFLGLTPMELLVILVVGVLLFGKKLPDVGRSLGRDKSGDEPPYDSGSRVPRPPKPPADSGSIALEPPQEV
jgi:hypothetical protein